jgi:cold shock CspA family protein
MIRGTLTTWYDDRGYGFIGRDDGQADVFVHIKAFTEGVEPVQSMKVEFDIGPNPKTGKPCAVKARVIG